VRWLLLANALAVVIIVALAATALIDSRAAHLQRAEVAAQNTARAMAQAVGAEIEQVDLLLRAVILGIERERRDGIDNPAAMQRILETRRVLLPELQVLRATDASGILRYGAGVADRPLIDVSDRDYFIRARDNPHLGLIVSEPLYGRASKRWVVAFARRLNADDGSFLGVVLATVAIERFQDILSGPDLGAQGAIGLRTSSMQLVARSTRGAGPSSAAVGNSNVSPQLRKALLAHPDGGAYIAVAALDKVERINAFMRVSNRPLYVIAGLGTGEFMAPWRQQARELIALAVAVSLILFISSWLLVRARRRERASMTDLQRESRRYQALLRTASDGIHVLDRRGHLVDLSDSFATMLGTTRDKLLGKPVGAWEATVSQEYIADWCRNAKGQGSFSTRHRRADGSLIDVEISSTTVSINGEDLIYCSSRDVTERSRLEAEARQNLERAQRSEYNLTQDLAKRVVLEQALAQQTRNLAAMTAVTGDISIVMDTQGRILVANRAFEDQWKMPAGGATGRTLQELYGPTFFNDVVMPRLVRVLAGESVKLRTVFEMRAYDVTYEAVRNERGEIDAVVFTSHDVNDLVEAVQQLQRTNESLEQFVRITSHDMREPLNTIVQFVGLIERQHGAAMAAPLDRYFAFVQRGAQRMKAMLDDLLRFVRLEADGEEASERVELEPLLREVESALSAQISATGGTLVLGPLPAVQGQRGLLALLFQNLVSNGLKFSRPGVAPQVTVSARQEGGQVIASVEDQGIGIAADDIPKLFEPFRRLHRRQLYEGTGLGLATCKRIVFALGGHIEISSQPGAWTRVTVTLPAG
jgi:PAS domain S-box-containing protein